MSFLCQNEILFIALALVARGCLLSKAFRSLLSHFCRDHSVFSPLWSSTGTSKSWPKPRDVQSCALSMAVTDGWWGRSSLMSFFWDFWFEACNIFPFHLNWNPVWKSCTLIASCAFKSLSCVSSCCLIPHSKFLSLSLTVKGKNHTNAESLLMLGSFNYEEAKIACCYWKYLNCLSEEFLLVNRESWVHTVFILVCLLCNWLLHMSCILIVIV